MTNNTELQAVQQEIELLKAQKELAALKAEKPAKKAKKAQTPIIVEAGRILFGLVLLTGLYCSVVETNTDMGREMPTNGAVVITY